jgi:adenosine 3'-phospho 5'-phosphosulfate transporter B2
MLITNVYSCLFTLISLVEQGHLKDSIQLLYDFPELANHVLMLSLASAIGQVFIFVTIEKFGALVFTFIMTTRQVLSIFLSCFLFNHPLSGRNVFGTTLIFFALFLQQFMKYLSKKNKQLVK